VQLGLSDGSASSAFTLACIGFSLFTMREYAKLVAAHGCVPATGVVGADLVRLEALSA